MFIMSGLCSWELNSGSRVRSAASLSNSGHGFPVGNDDRRQFGAEQIVYRLVQGFWRQAAQVIHFRAAQYLYAVGVHEIEVADQRQ